MFVTQSHTRPAGTAEIQVLVTEYSYCRFFSSAHSRAKSERKAIGVHHVPRVINTED